jgi:hydroxylamine reductase (hybrid-cluster protein)
MTDQTIRTEAERRASDRADQEIIRKALDEGIETVWDRFELQQPQCGFGQLGVCCNNCAMGPCRVDPFGGKTSHGVVVQMLTQLLPETCLMISASVLQPILIMVERLLKSY